MKKPTFSYYIIKHNPTGFTIPQAHGFAGRGSSHVEPLASRKREDMEVVELRIKL
jgi:hypothetical protein